MIVLVQPMYSRQEINSDSNYILYSSLIRAMRSVRPEYQFVVIFPDSRSHYKYDDDGFFSLSNVSRVSARMSPRRMGNSLHFDATFHDQLFRNIGFDALLCNNVETAAQVSQSGQATFADAGRPLSLACHYYVIHRSLPYLFDRMMEHVAFAQCMGAHACDTNVFNSDHCEWMFFDMAKEFLSSQAIAKIRANSTMIPMGTLEKSLRYVETDNDPPVILYNHRLQTYKNYKKTFEILNELYEEGVKFKVIVTSSASENTSRVLHYPFVELKLCATREDYLKVLVGCDLNVTNSQHETFCMSAAESMACGQPLIAPDGITFPQITNAKENGYPYLFTSETEQVSYLRKLLTDRNERRKWGRILSDHVTREYHHMLWAERYANHIETLLADEKFVPNTAEDVMEDLASRLKLSSGAGIKEFWNIVAQRKINGRIPWGSQSLPYTKLVRLVRKAGGHVKLERGVQRVYC